MEQTVTIYSGIVPNIFLASLPSQADLSSFPPDSEGQQAAVLAVADRDAFNWGYDPVHYGVPEGSYSSEPDGPLRVLEYREMVQALHWLGLSVVLDVVYNHTFRWGGQARLTYCWLLFRSIVTLGLTNVVALGVNEVSHFTMVFVISGSLSATNSPALATSIWI